MPIKEKAIKVTASTGNMDEMIYRFKSDYDN